MKLRLKKHRQVLTAVDDEGMEFIQSLSPDWEAEVSIKIDRNPGNHRRFFLFIQTAFDNQDHFNNIEEFRFWLTCKAGYYDTIKTPNGNVIYKAQSISWKEMEDEDKFRKLFNHCIDAYLKEFNQLTKNQIFQIVDFV